MHTAYWTHERYSRLARSVASELGRLGYSLPSGCRVSRLIEVCARWETLTLQKRSIYDPHVSMSQSCFYELRQLAIIVPLLKSAPDEWRASFHRLCSGAFELDAEQQTNCDPRNAQFELFVASRMRNAGATVQAKEPDIICTHGGVSFGVACKRLQGEGGLAKRLHHAGQQIERSGLNGFIALDLTNIVVGSKENRLEGYEIEHTHTALFQKLCGLDDRLRELAWNEGRHCFGVLSFVFARTQGCDTLRIGTWFGSRLVPRRAQMDPSLRWIDRLASALSMAASTEDSLLQQMVDEHND